MTIGALTIAAITSFIVGIIHFSTTQSGSSVERLIEARLTAMIFILSGIFLALFALLFKANPIW